MSNSGGVIRAPISLENDVVPVLQAGTYSLEALCKHPNINKWSYIKPLQDSALSEQSFSIAKYKQSLSRVYIRTPSGTIPSADYEYRNRPTSNFRLLDFNGYNHNSFAAKCDVVNSIPSNIDFDNCRYTVPIEISPEGLWEDLLLTTPGDRWDNALLLVCKKGSTVRTFRTSKENRYSNGVLLYLGDSMNVNRVAYDKFKAMGIADWTVDIVVVAIPQDHSDKADGFIEITSTTDYQVYPLTTIAGRTWNPLKKGVRISNPKPRSFWSVGINEQGTYRNEYIPEDCIMGGYLIAFKTNTTGDYLWNDRGASTYTYAEWKRATGDNRGGTIARGQILVGSSGYKYLEGEIYINYYRFPGQNTATRPIIVQTGTNAKIQWGATQVTIRSENMGVSESNIDSNVFVAFYFVDPNERE